MNIKEKLFKLSNCDGVGCIEEASLKAEEMLSSCCATERAAGLTVLGYLKGESDYTVLLDAHIDQIAMIVTAIDDNGFITVSKSGGIDIRCLPSRRVTLHGKQKITAVFCAVPPHLSKGSSEYNDISEIKLDTGLGAKAKEIISVGDYATFNTKPYELLGDCVAGRSFDDRAAAACLVEIAERLKDKKLPVNVVFCFSDGEELGCRGARTAVFKADPDEALVLDVSFGNGIGISPEHCGKLGGGAMIGISPCLDKAVSQKLIKIAKEKGVSHQAEVMGERSGTNADVISISREGVKTATVSIPLRNMHTDCEILDIRDLESVCELICEYILDGGVLNA